MNGDKRPFTAQNLQGLSTNMKRVGGVYGNSQSGKSGNVNATAYNLANAAFVSQPAAYMNAVGARTHASGFSFQPNGA